jgi:hypothetical protein
VHSERALNKSLSSVRFHSGVKRPEFNAAFTTALQVEDDGGVVCVIGALLDRAGMHVGGESGTLALATSGGVGGGGGLALGGNGALKRVLGGGRITRGGCAGGPGELGPGS